MGQRRALSCNRARRIKLETLPIRYGLTASRKVGNAVTRNRARRRLRVLAHDILPRHAAPGYDYVLIARAATAPPAILPIWSRIC